MSTQELCTYLSEPWDLIVLDLQLSSGGWEGLDFLLEFRRSNRVTPVLVCTGKGAKREVKKAFELGADALVFKEDIAQELVIVVDKLLDSSVRFRDIVEQFPTPIAYLGRRFIEATSELEQLRVAFDLFEMAMKLIMIYCLAELEDNSSCPDELRAHVERKILLVPALGDWVHGVGLIGRTEIDQSGQICDKLRSTLRAEKLINVITGAVRARNLLTHGVTPLGSSCKEYVQEWWPVFFKFLTRCTPLHTHQMVVVDSLERDRDGFVAKILRIIGSSPLLRKDQLRCENPPFTSHVSLERPDSKSLITLHPWIRVSSATVNGHAIRIYDKTLASSRVEGQRVPRPSDLVEYVDLISGEKLRIGEFSDFKNWGHPPGQTPQS